MAASSAAAWAKCPRWTKRSLPKQISKDDTVRAAYLAEQGKDIEPVLKEKVWDSFGNLALQDYTEKIGAQELARLYVKLETGERLTEAELETARESIMDAWIADHEYALNRRPELRETRIARQRDKISDARVGDFIRNAEALYEDGGQTRDGVDRYATQDKPARRWTMQTSRRGYADRFAACWVSRASTMGRNASRLPASAGASGKRTARTRRRTS